MSNIPDDDVLEMQIFVTFCKWRDIFREFGMYDRSRSIVQFDMLSSLFTLKSRTRKSHFGFRAQATKPNTSGEETFDGTSWESFHTSSSNVFVLHADRKQCCNASACGRHYWCWRTQTITSTIDADATLILISLRECCSRKQEENIITHVSPSQTETTASPKQCTNACSNRFAIGRSIHPNSYLPLVFVNHRSIENSINELLTHTITDQL